MRGFSWIGLAAGALLGWTAAAADTSPAIPMSRAAQAHKVQLLARSAGSESGEVLSTRDSILTLRPFHGGARHFDFTPMVPVYEAGEENAVSVLQPGMSVRVYYVPGRSGTRPALSAVEVLSPKEVQTLEGR